VLGGMGRVFLEERRMNPFDLLLPRLEVGELEGLERTGDQGARAIAHHPRDLVACRNVVPMSRQRAPESPYDVVERVEQGTIEIKEHGMGTRKPHADIIESARLPRACRRAGEPTVEVLASLPSLCHPKGVSRAVLPNRREFALFATAATASLVAACRTHTPRVPTKPAPSSSTAALGTDLQAEILETEDGNILIDANDPQRGPRDAHAVLVVFSDFECPFCRDMALVLERLRKELPKRVRVVFKHLPIPSHTKARTAAVASQVVFLEAGSDAFWRFHDRCFAHPHDLELDHLSAWARDEGVKAESIAKRGPEADKIVAQHVALAERLGIRGTPRLYINARRVGGAYPYDQIREWVDDEL